MCKTAVSPSQYVQDCCLANTICARLLSRHHNMCKTAVSPPQGHALKVPGTHHIKRRPCAGVGETWTFSLTQTKTNSLSHRQAQTRATNENMNFAHLHCDAHKYFNLCVQALPHARPQKILTNMQIRLHSRLWIMFLIFLIGLPRNAFGGAC